MLCIIPLMAVSEVRCWKANNLRIRLYQIVILYKNQYITFHPFWYSSASATVIHIPNPWYLHVFLDVLIAYSHPASSNQIQNETNHLHHSMKPNNDHPSFCDQLESAITVSCDDKYKPNHLFLTNPAYAAPNLWGSIGIGGSPADLGIRSSATFHENQWTPDRRFNNIRNNIRQTSQQYIEHTNNSNNHNENQRHRCGDTTHIASYPRGMCPMTPWYQHFFCYNHSFCNCW